MKKHIGIILLTLLLGIQGIAQVYTSEASTIRINNLPEEVKDETIVYSPPEIRFITPILTEEVPYRSAIGQINLIGKAIDEEGINSIIVNSNIVDYSEAGVFTSSISLQPGSNEIKVIVMDGGDNLVEKSYVIEFEPPVLSFAEKVSKESKYYGLIIGVESYLDPDIEDLDHPIRDAMILYDVLIEDYIFEEENVTLIKNATREDIITSLDDLSKRVTPNDNVLIFYAGHGWWDPEADNGFWLPSDAADDKKTDWFRNSALVDYLKEVDSKHTLLITDACFGGAIFKTRSAFADAPKAIEILYDLKSRKAMTSGTMTEVPDESVFIKYLVDALKKNKEKYVNSEQLFSSFRTAVINNSDALPQFGEIRYVGDEGGDFIFIKK